MDNHLSFGAVFDRTAEIYKSHFKTLLATAFAVFVFVFAILLVLALAIDTGSGALVAFVAVVDFCLIMIATYVYQGMVVRIVQGADDGREHSVGELYESVKPVLVPLIFTGILATIFLMIGFMALIIPGLILLAHFAVIAPIVVIERVNYMDAIKRSWALTKGNAWTVFAIVIVLSILLAIGHGILGAIGSIGGVVGIELGRFVALMLLSPFPAIAATTMYLMLSGAKAPVAGSAPAAGLGGGMPGAAGASASAPPPPPGK